jgi:putative chitinase
VAQRGLHDMGRHGNVFVGLATTPGLTVPDGVGAHSYYAARLIEALATRADQPLSLIFDDINELVHQDSEQAQFPEYINNLGVPRWCFKSGPLCGDTRTRPVASVYTSRFLKSLDRDRLLELTNDNEGFVDTLLARRDLLASNGIDSPLRLAHFLAAIGLETDFRKGFVEENLNFSAARLVTVFPTKFPDLDAAAPYAHDPEKIANLIYAGKLGNGDEASGDGWNFRGRGYFLFTGRHNYQLVLQSTGIDVLRAPDLLNDPEVSLAATAAYWSQRDLNASADADDFASVGKRISGRPYRRGPQMLEAAKRAVGLP